MFEHQSSKTDLHAEFYPRKSAIEVPFLTTSQTLALKFIRIIQFRVARRKFKEALRNYFDFLFQISYVLNIFLVLHMHCADTLRSGNFIPLGNLPS